MAVALHAAQAAWPSCAYASGSKKLFRLNQSHYKKLRLLVAASCGGSAGKDPHQRAGAGGAVLVSELDFHKLVYCMLLRYHSVLRPLTSCTRCSTSGVSALQARSTSPLALRHLFQEGRSGDYDGGKSYFSYYSSSVSYSTPNKRDKDEGSRLMDSSAATFRFVFWEAGIWQINVHRGTFKRVPEIAI